MQRHIQLCCGIILSLAFAQRGLAAGTVTISLGSPNLGSAVQPGELIEWNITATVSEEDNLGLAAILVDLIQASDNPELFELPPADGVPSGMAAFSRPDGFSNPGPGGTGSAYAGTPVGSPGATDLIQIGGLQNTFGVSSGGVGLDVDVDLFIGQSANGQLIATGSFAAPTVPGEYTMTLGDVLANTLEDFNPAPAFSAVGPAMVEIDQSKITFAVIALCPADLNGDDLVNATDLASLLGAWGPNPGDPADINGDDIVDATDLAQLLGSWGPCP